VTLHSEHLYVRKTYFGIATVEHFFYFINLVQRDVWIQPFELLPILCKQHNAFYGDFDCRCPSEEGQLQLYKFVNYKKICVALKEVQAASLSIVSMRNRIKDDVYARLVSS